MIDFGKKQTNFEELSTQTGKNLNMNSYRSEAIKECIKLIAYCEQDGDIHTRIHRRILSIDLAYIIKLEVSECRKTRKIH